MNRREAAALAQDLPARDFTLKLAADALNRVGILGRAS